MKPLKTWVCFTLAVSLAAVGCKKEESVPPPAAASASTAPVTSAAAAPAAAAPVATTLPMKEDYETAAQEAITEDNVEAQVKALESEITAK
jgi:hypothetical protein